MATRQSFFGALFGAFFLAGALHASDDAAGDVVTMNRFIVEALRVDRTPWLYVSVPDYEILSRCDQLQTGTEAGSVLTGLRLETAGIIWPAYLPEPATPMSLIMFDRELPKAVAGFAPNPIEIGEQPNFGAGVVSNWTNGCLDVSDADTMTVIQSRWRMENFFPGGLLGTGPVPAGVWFKLGQAAPAPALWYQAAFDGATRLNRVNPVNQRQPVTLASALWVSAERTKAILAAAKKAKARPALPPIEELFRAKRKNGQELSPELKSEAALFVRWGIFEQDANNPGHFQAFAAFCERSRIEPVTEAMFRDCFGFGYAEMQARLSAYFPKAVESPFEMGYGSRTPFASRLPEIQVKEATADQVGRILGDWMRMEGNILRARDPGTSAQCFHAAGLLLARAYQEDTGLPPDVDPAAAGGRTVTIPGASLGPIVAMKPYVVSADRIHDPRLLAVYGMYDHDSGDYTQARVLLEAAVKARVIRATVYFDLAQINFAEAERRPAGIDGKLSAAQTAAILAPLFGVPKPARLGADGYRLMAETWVRSATKPSLANLAAVDHGLRLYPFDTALRVAVTKAYAQWSYAAEADAHISQGLRFVDEETARQLVSLRAAGLGR